MNFPGLSHSLISLFSVFFHFIHLFIRRMEKVGNGTEWQLLRIGNTVADNGTDFFIRPQEKLSQPFINLLHQQFSFLFVSVRKQDKKFISSSLLTFFFQTVPAAL